MAGGNGHCIVIGAGTVGACCAWHLVRRGNTVTLVDREMPGQATSYGNAACISPSMVVPFSHPGVWKRIPGWLLSNSGPLTIRWRDLPWLAPWLWRFWRHGTAEHVQACAQAQAALMGLVTDDFRETLKGSGQSRFLRAKGLILLYDSVADFEADRWQYDLKQQFGYSWDILGRQELQVLAPAIDLRDGMALYIPSWSHTTDPGKMTAGIAEAACAAGGEFVHDEVTGVAAGRGRVLVHTKGERKLEADHLVIAAGPWSNALAEQLDFRVPMAAKRGYHAMIAKPGVDLEFPVMSGTRMFVMNHLDDGLRLAGTAEFARLDARPDYRRARVLLKHARHYLPDLKCEGVTEWMGQRPMMVDSLPVISASPAHANVHYAFGHGHYGLTQGPTTGRLVAAMVSGDSPPIDMKPYRFDRFN